MRGSFAWVCVAAALVAACGHATPRTWTGADGTDPTDWFRDNNWSPALAPQEGDDVVIDSVSSSNVVLTNATAVLSSVTLTNGVRLTFSGWNTVLSATNLFVLSGSTITHATNTSETAPATNRVRLVCTNLTIGAGGSIRADAKGYAAAQGPGKGLINGVGSRGGGGGYGGVGGVAEDYASPGNPYGSTNAPVLPGSGGADATYGGAGGGSIRIEASGTATVNGTITANGGAGAGGYVSASAGGGSGGAISITCGTFSGGAAGLVQVRGGDAGTYGGSYYSGSGGGGRIALDCGSVSVATGFVFSGAYGRGSSTDGRPTWQWPITYPDVYRRRLPGWGTLWLPDTGLLSSAPGAGLFTDVSLHLGSGASWTAGSLSLASNTLAFGQDGFQLAVPGDVTLGTGAVLVVGVESGSRTSVLDCGGNLVLTNGARLHVYSGPTNGAAGAYGALISVTGDLALARGSWLYPGSHPANGGSVLVRAANVRVASNAVVNASGRGFAAETGPGKGVYSGYRGGGGGYGGKGGRGDVVGAVGGSPYGVTNAPVLPGSGGGYAGVGGRGGGAIRIEAGGTVSLNGTMAADGVNSEYDGPGGGSGGGIFITCASFGGGTGGVLRARGADGRQPAGAIYYGGGGGGGRIAVGLGLSSSARDSLIANASVPGLYAYGGHAAFAGAVSAAFGLGYTNLGPDAAAAGTAWFLTTNLSLTVAGSPAPYGQPAPLGYGTSLEVSAGEFITNAVASPVDQAGGSRHACVGWTLRDILGGDLGSDSSTQAVVSISTNTVLTWLWTNEYQLAVSAGPGGAVNSGAVDGWYAQGVAVTNVEATASNGYAFSEWTGDVPAGHEADNPLSVTMDQARSLQASFVTLVSATRVWQGVGAWESAGNWTPGGMPGTLDTAIIGAGTVTVSTARQMDSLVVSNGAAVLFTNWTATLTASNSMLIESGGVVTVSGPFTGTQMSNRIALVAATFTLADGALITADGKGYSAQEGPGHGLKGSQRATGGGHGGRGGRDEQGTAGGVTYGSLSAPIDPGSGGGDTNNGSAGGGAIRIVVSGVATLDGTISANAGTAIDDPSAGGGSGGAIFITTSNLAMGARSVLRAQGGNAGRYLGTPGNYYSGEGGGGRIALQYSNATFAAGSTFSCASGHGYPSDGRPSGQNPVIYADYYRLWPARFGTLHASDAGLLETNPSGRFQAVALTVADMSSWAPASLTMTNGTLALPAEGLSIEVAGDLTLGTGGRLEVGWEGMSSGPVVRVGGALTVTNGGALHIFAGATNGVAGTNGAYVTVAGQLLAGPGSWILPYAHPTNGGHALFSAASVVLFTNAGFNATGRGFGAGYGPGKGAYDGGANRSGGGAHGGKGGRGESVTSLPGAPYDNVYAPLIAGSGGGSAGGGAGGGVVRLESRGAVKVYGTVQADGAAAIDGGAGGGGGGAIFIRAGAFSGDTNGLLRANGGDGGYHLSTKYSGEGGGGRVAVLCSVWDSAAAQLIAGLAPGGMTATETYERFSGRVSVTNGIGYFATGPNAGAIGTRVFITFFNPGTVIMIE